MVDAVVSFAIEKLNEFLVQEFNIMLSEKDGIRWLKDELGYLQISVRAAEVVHDSEVLLSWTKEVRNVANDAVLVLERFKAYLEEHAARDQGVLDFMHCCPCFSKKEAKLYIDSTMEIESLKRRVVEIKNRRSEYRIDEMVSVFYKRQEQRDVVKKQRNKTLLRSISLESQADVVGFQDDFNTLLAVLDGPDPSLGYISIHGMGGLGKTTLARKLYQSSQLSHFKRRAWVSVSLDYQVKDILVRIYRSFKTEELSHVEDVLNLDEEELVLHIRELLLHVDCSYLVVIDDLWDLGVWEKIKSAFPDNKNASRVIATTRIKGVAEGVDETCLVHELRLMTEDESWELFCRRVKPTPNLENLGREMVDKCSGLPLAIVVLSGLLLHKESYKEWLAVKDHLWRTLKTNSVEIVDILSLGYGNLPFQLRQCFAYLARFPEDYTFSVYKIKMLWIAEEFISEADEGDGVLMEDVADYCLNELIHHSMIQIVPMGGQVSVCHVHNLVRDLAIEKARENKILGIFDPSKQVLSPIRLLEEQHRHAIYNGIGEYLKLFGSNNDGLRLRSLAVINETRFMESEDMNLMYTRFKYLSVLDLTGVESDEMAKEIGDMVLLKFLGLTGNTNNKPLIVPSTINKLKRLQTLFGSENSHYNFPSEIGELRKLRHLKFSHATTNLKFGSHQRELQTLEVISYEDWIQIDTASFFNLRTLSITANDASPNIPYSLDSMAYLKSLRTLALDFLASSIIPTIGPLSGCRHLTSVTLKGMIEDPSELRFLPDSVTTLTLRGSKFTEDPMPTLGSHLLGLAFLHLNKVYQGGVMVCGDDVFPCLQILKIDDFPNLEEWQVDDGAMPSLKAFQVDGCEKLKTIPERLKEVPSISVTFPYLKFT
ncbi:disease resistance protein RPP13-like [Apium graveolens]|uniref:disease resistance protein RPP13-like n=1 Tax=Apium graveolens TaxID=4045 RepID=UPI003D7B889C